MSADDAMQPDSTADELENASSTTDDVELAADQPEDPDVEIDVASEDVAASPDAIAEPSEETDLEPGLADAAADAVTADDMAAADMAADDVSLSTDTVAANDLLDNEVAEEVAEDLTDVDSSVDNPAPEDGVDEVGTDIGSDTDAADATDESWTETVADASAATAESGVDEILDSAAEADDAASDADEAVDEAVNEPDEVEAEANDAANYADDEADEVEADYQDGAEVTGDAVPSTESDVAEQTPEQPSAQPFQQPSEEPLADSTFVTPSIPSQILQTIQTILAIVLPILRVVTVLTLKLTIRVLQFVVDLLDEPQSTPAATSDQPAAATPKAAQEFSSESRRSAIAYSAADLANPSTEEEDSDVKRVRFTIDDIYQDDGSLRPLSDRVREIWQDLIRVMRAPLPTAMNEQIPDKVFSFILAAVLAIVVWNLAIFILPFHPAPRPAKVAEPQPTQVAQPAQDKSKADSPAPSEPDAAPAPAVAPPITPSTEPAPAQPAPTPAPTATPQLELEPQEALIEAIQEQVSDVTQRYADNLIQSVQANFRDGRLTVRVSDDWYRLAASQQDQVATDLLKRTKTLDFGKLELIDSQDNRVARSPIVGSKMLILQRDRTDITGPIGTTEPEPAQPDLSTDNTASSAESSTDAAATTPSAGDSDA